MSDNWVIIHVPIGDDEVICDLCNADIGDEEGGSFIGTYAVCQNCTDRILKNSNEKEKNDMELELL